MTQILEKQIFQGFYIFRQFFFQFLICFLASNGFKNQQWLTQVSPVSNFKEINAFFVESSLKKTQKSIKQQKSTLFDKLITIFVQTTKVSEEYNFQWPEGLNNKVFKTQ